MAKRLPWLVIAAAAFFVVVVPAFAFNGYRPDYTTSDYCAICHTAGQPVSAPKVYNEWAETKHAESNADGQSTRLPYGSSCAGCHTANYEPNKVIPVPTATTTTPAPTPTATNIAWGPSPTVTTQPQGSGSAPFSEPDVGCSSCHYGVAAAAQYGNDPNDTAHTAPNANLANAEICGQCHTRFSYTVATYPVAPIPYVKVDAAGDPIPNPNPTTLLQPQYALGFKMLGEPPSWVPPLLTSVLNVQSPGWVPTPTATTAAGLQHYWQNTNGTTTMWQADGHDGSAAQYADWKTEGHRNALADLKAKVGDNPPASCLKCHSTDYRIAPADAKPTGAQAKYGVTCVGCHTPHNKGTQKSLWTDEFDAQLITDNTKTMCTQCHTAEIPEGTQASPGAEIHFPMKEMIDGYGAIDVPSFPSVHKGKCVQCHMPPTSISRGAVQLGANHTFTIITPAQAANVVPRPFSTTTPVPGGTPVVTMTTMPYSACTTCHSRPNDNEAVWLQDTIDQRQEWTRAKIAEIHTAIDAAAVRMHYASADAAHTAIVDTAAAKRTKSQTNFLKSFTNVEFVESEGSFGLHNWDYSRDIVNVALNQANMVATTPQTVKMTVSKARASRGAKVKFRGTVRPKSTGKITIQRKVKGVWKTWRRATLNAKGNFVKSVKMTARGTFTLRAFLRAKPPYAGGKSKAIKVIVN